MVRPYFIFKEQNSKDFDVHIRLLPPIQTVDEEVELIEIPGRDGYLTILTGRKPTLVKTFGIVIHPFDKIEQIKRWLTGSGKLIISNEPNVYYQARIQTVRDLWSFKSRDDTIQITFSCQPNPIQLIEGSG